jgi:tRNA-uridine 2-sulfurtransferase
VIERLKPGAAEPGEIVDLEGRVLGKHPGIVHYTIGQRRGLGIPSHEALFVVRLDPARRRVIVGPRSALVTHRFRVADLNWIGDAPAADIARDGLPVFVRVRSTRPPQAALLFVSGAEAEVEIEHGEEAIAPGQACVIYDSADTCARVLGGGVIRAIVQQAALPREPLRAAV